MIEKFNELEIHDLHQLIFRIDLPEYTENERDIEDLPRVSPIDHLTTLRGLEN